MKMIVTLAAAGIMAVSGPALAQSPVRVEAEAGAEWLTYRYRFENDSSFDTPFLVPHFFEQRYERTAPLLGARARYRLLGRAMETMAAFSPETLAFGSDFDTFMQPDGDVAGSGTAGDVRLASIQIEQAVALSAGADPAFAVIFGWRRDRADFLPTDRVVTHTRPPSETREWITDRERTVSQTFEVAIEGRRAWKPQSRWIVTVSGRAAPALRARLLVQLPDKYPGRDIVFTAAGWSGRVRVDASRAVAWADAGAWIGYERAGSYRSAAQFERNALSGGVLIAFGSRR